MPFVVQSAPESVAAARLRLAVLVVLLGSVGAGLHRVAGLPRLPERLPAPAEVTSTLTGAVAPVDGLAAALLALTWLMWGWLTASVILEAALRLADTLAHGAMWVQRVRPIADRLTLPLARRLVATAFAVQLMSRAVPAAAAPLPSEHAFISQARESRDADSASSSAWLGRAPDAAMSATYLVRPGDTLWSIAESAYGSGTEYRRLVTANVGRRMPDGQLFGPQGVIQPGWRLDVPEPSWQVDEVDGERWYTVRPGDTLRGISARLLRDEDAWQELFDFNQGAATADATRKLSNPDLIWPGLRLRLPGRAPLAAEPILDPAAAETVEPQLVVATAPPPPVVVGEADDVPGSNNDAVGVVEAPETLPPLVRDVHPIPPFALDQPEPIAEMVADSTPEPPTTPPGSVPLQALGAVGLVALAGAATLGARRMRRWRPLPTAPESEVVVEGGYAEARLTHEFARHLNGGSFETATAVATQLQQLFDELELASARVVAVCYGRSSTTVTVAVGLADQPLLEDLAPVLGTRLGAECDAWISADQDVVLRLTRVRKTRLLPPADASSAGAPCLLPIGVLYDKQVYSAAWQALGNVLVASMPGQGAETILTSLIATLTARRSPGQTRLVIIGHPRALPAPLAELPHVQTSVDPADREAVCRTLERLADEVDSPADDKETEVVIMVPELTALGDAAADLDRLVRSGRRRLRLIAGTTDPLSTAQSTLLAHFTTRLVLRMDEEEASMALLGSADAAYLDRGGRLVLRLDGREPVELYGYQVAAEHLERLVKLMRSAYPGRVFDEPMHLGRVTPEPARVSPPDHGDPPEPPAAPPSFAALEPDPPSEPPLAPAMPEAFAEPEPPASPSAAHEPPLQAPSSPPRLQPMSSESAAGPLVQVVCFGGPRVLAAGQQVWPLAPGGDAKPWELLLFLACQRPEGALREDVIAALWPDDGDVGRAAHRFRQLRYRLRQSIATVVAIDVSEGICLERSGILRLDLSVVQSDAHQFTELIRQARVFGPPHSMARLERARELYVADLFVGKDARRYAWVDERGEGGVTLREHFRRQFQQATLLLAEQYVEADRLAEAVELYRELTDMDPGDERVWRTLFQVHARRGDRGALLREERRLRETLRELAVEEVDSPVEVSPEPSRETLDEIRRLLRELDTPARTATAV